MAANIVVQTPSDVRFDWLPISHSRLPSISLNSDYLSAHQSINTYLLAMAQPRPPDSWDSRLRCATSQLSEARHRNWRPWLHTLSFDPALQSPVCRGDSVPEVTKPTTMSSCQPQRHLCPLSAICTRAARTAECPFLGIWVPLNVCALPGTQSWLPHSGPMQMCGTPKGQSPEPTGLRCLVPEVLPIPDPTLAYVEGTAAWEGPQLPEQRP